MAHPLGELCIHHEVVNMFLSLGEFQLPGHDGHHQCSAACSLCVVGGRITIPRPGTPSSRKPSRCPGPSATVGGGHEKLHRKEGGYNATVKWGSSNIQGVPSGHRGSRQVLSPGIVTTECRDCHDEPVSTLVGGTNMSLLGKSHIDKVKATCWEVLEEILQS